MRKRFLILLVALLFTVPALAAEDEILLDSGPITGTANNFSKEVRIYRGIPYAAPPVGDLRWKEPQPVKPWNGLKACVIFGPSCPQPAGLIGGAAGKTSEDCLYLNVFTAAKEGEKQPVMVWIHGGGFTIGSGSVALYDGSALARKGVIVVTINYRLGPFGFFAHPLLSQESPNHVSGNYGLLDQIAALQWVQRNIKAFGGDPNCVTIFGESAGSASVARLMVCPLAKDLFHRAIAESGGPIGWNRSLRKSQGMMESAENMGSRIAKDLRCDSLDQLRRISAQDLLKATKPIMTHGVGNRFGPVVDGYVLPDSPAELWADGKQFDVPFITGSNSGDGAIFLVGVPTNSVPEYRAGIHALFPTIADDLLRLFPAESDDQVHEAALKLVTVKTFAQPARFMVRCMESKKSPAYLYQFSRVPQMLKSRTDTSMHGAELFYVFDHVPPLARFREIDAPLALAMSGAWVRFAKTGNPNGDAMPPWSAYHRGDETYMDFGDEVTPKHGLFREAADLFDKVQDSRE